MVCFRGHTYVPRDTHAQGDHLLACGQRMLVNIGTYQMVSISILAQKATFRNKKNERAGRGKLSSVRLRWNRVFR